MSSNNAVFLEVIEWFDSGGQQLVHRIPEHGSAEIKFGAQLIVRESQMAVFFYNGKAVEVFGPGRHTLKTANIPILTKLLSVPWALTSPLRAEVYMVGTHVFSNLKWGTREPVAFRDSQLGLVRLRAHGVFNLQIVQPLLFINRFVGSMGLSSSLAVEDYLRSVIVSRLNDELGETLSSLLDLPGKYESLSLSLQQRLRDDFSHFGLAVTHLYVTSITPPPDVQQAIDDRGRLQAIGNLDELVKLKAAMAMEKAASAPGGAGEGVGMGMGLMMPMMMAQAMAPQSPSATSTRTSPAPTKLACPGCESPVSTMAHFCAACGQQLVVFDQCRRCETNLAPGARFCSQCGSKVEVKPENRVCGACQSENLPASIFCNQCGERL